MVTVIPVSSSNGVTLSPHILFIMVMGFCQKPLLTVQCVRFIAESLLRSRTEKNNYVMYLVNDRSMQQDTQGKTVCVQKNPHIN